MPEVRQFESPTGTLKLPPTAEVSFSKALNPDYEMFYEICRVWLQTSN